MAAKNLPSYQQLSDELDDIMIRLQGEDVDVDEAVQLYGRGMEVVAQLQSYLKTAKNKVEKIKLKFS